MKPRLLLISRKWPPAIGGMETYSVELAAALELRFQVTRLVLPGRPDGRPPSLLGYGWFLAKAMLYCLFRGREFSHLVVGDLILFPAALCCRLVRKQQQRIVVVYGLDLVYGQRHGLLPCLYAGYFGIFRACQSLFSNVVAISTYTASLAEEARLRSVRTVHPSLPTTPLTTAATGEAELPPPFVQAQRRILQFGRLVTRKGALWFAQNVLPQLPDDVELFVVGSAHGYDDLDALKSCRKTHYLGPMRAAGLAALIRSANVVIMPNTPSPVGGRDVEGFGLVAIETSSLGGVLAASRLQGISDAVLDGVTGVLVEPGNVSAWRHALLQLLDEPTEQRMRRRVIAQQKTREHYSRQRMSDSFAEFLTTDQ